MKEQGSENPDQANVLYIEYKQSFDSVMSGRSFIKPLYHNTQKNLRQCGGDN